jgi:DNA topoisomerase-1
LGTDPASGKPVLARMGRYGPMVQIGVQSDEEKPRFAKLKTTQSIETISMDEAMDLFKLPLSVGEHEGQEVSINIGRFGPYVKFGEQFISIPKGEEPTDVDLQRAIEIINMKKVEDAPIGFFDEKSITKGKGRFGPFIKWNDLFINVPRAYNFDTLSQKDCNELIEKKIEKEANRFIKQWPEEKIAIENGRWGPFIRHGKKMLKLSGKPGGGKYTPEEIAEVELDEVKKMILQQDPKAFDKKAAAKKSASKKAAPKKAGAKKTATKKAAAKK